MGTLIKLKACYADEFDCEQFIVVPDMTPDQTKERLELIVEPNDDYDAYGFGTNEALSGNDIRDGVTYTELKPGDVGVFQNYFPCRTHQTATEFGTGPMCVDWFHKDFDIDKYKEEYL